MTTKRLWHMLMLNVQRHGYARADYLRKHQLFKHIGSGVYYQGRNLPLYAELISLGNNVNIASKVTFITHSIIHYTLNANKDLGLEKPVQEQVGCIEIGDNVFIGAGTTILSNVRIGSNVVIAAGSIITKDVPSNCVVGGVPAKVIRSMDEYLEKLTKAPRYPDELRPQKQTVSKELADYLWKDFEAQRKADE